MKKRLTGIFVALVLMVALVPLVPAGAAPGVLDHVIISPTSANITVGATQQFTAQGQDSSNTTISDLTYSWAVVAGGGTIGNNGLFTAGNVTGNFTNTVQVTAVQGSTNVTAYASIIVSPAPVPTLDHVIVSPTSASITAGATQQFTAQGQDSSNVTIPDLTYSWAVVAGGGTIDNNGLFTAGNVTGPFINTVQVTAVQGDIIKTAYASVIVTPAPVPAEVSAVKLPLGWSKGNKNGWKGGTTPPGWSKGNKNGWDNGMPPGLAKGKKG